MLSVEYEMEKTTLTKDSIEDFVIVNPRKLHIGQVNSIYTSLLDGKHFDVPFVVNRLVERGKGSTKFCRKTGKLWTICNCKECKTRKSKHTVDIKIRIIDANHRVAALKKFFEKYPDQEIEIWSAIYENLSPDEERLVFTRWNIPVTQSTDDFINSYRATIPMFNRFIRDLPCTVYGSNNKMKLRDMVNAYSASFQNPYHGGEGKTKINVVSYLQRLKDKDIDVIKKNFGILQQVFNPDDKKDWRNMSPFKNIIFRALYYLVSNNLNRLGEEYICKRMKTELAGRTILDQYRRYYGRRASVDAYLAFQHLLNDSVTDEKKFI